MNGAFFTFKIILERAPSQRPCIKIAKNPRSCLSKKNWGTGTEKLGNRKTGVPVPV